MRFGTCSYCGFTHDLRPGMCHALPAPPETPPAWPFAHGSYVRKKSGAKWEGVVVSCYRSWVTGEWHAVVECLSERVQGAQHLYPTKALEKI